jgi:serine/threonine protein kinase
VWAFGCVFYEMLTGTRPFEGEDVSDVLRPFPGPGGRWQISTEGAKQNKLVFVFNFFDELRRVAPPAN